MENPVMAFLFMAKNPERHALRKMATVLGVSLSGCHAWFKGSPAREG